MRSQYVVIGAGRVGVSTVWSLARRGQELTLVTDPTRHRRRQLARLGPDFPLRLSGGVLYRARGEGPGRIRRVGTAPAKFAPVIGHLAADAASEGKVLDQFRAAAVQAASHVSAAH